ncbi:MAG: beta-lactamase family protein [Gammaproteobacteria bacterium]|nr:beta-lactamase family protein [Gammaproteobacteria bacterium]
MSITIARKILIVYLCTFLISCGTKLPAKLQVPYVENIDVEALNANMDSQFPEMLSTEGIPGISIGIIDDFKLVLTKSYGVRSVNAQALVTDETIFEFASLSKPVFALAVLQLSEKGILDLDKPLLEYLEFRELVEDEKNKLITARIVLSHSTGLPNWPDGNQIRISSIPGKEFSYSGMGYHYLQRVVEKLTGKPLQSIVEDEVFTPLMMTNSSFVWNNRFNRDKAAGHSSTGSFSRSLRESSTGVSASSLLSTIKDYSKFLIHVLKRHQRGESIVESMVAPVTFVKSDGDWGQLFWGLGWGIEETSEGTSIWHWGNNNEFRSLVVAHLKSGIGLIYVTNSASGLRPVSEIIQNTIGGIHPLTRFRYVH